MQYAVYYKFRTIGAHQYRFLLVKSSGTLCLFIGATVPTSEGHYQNSKHSNLSPQRTVNISEKPSFQQKLCENILSRTTVVIFLSTSSNSVTQHFTQSHIPCDIHVHIKFVSCILKSVMAEKKNASIQYVFFHTRIVKSMK